MKISLRNKILINFLVIIGMMGIVTTLIGVHLIGDGIVRQAQEKVRMDLNTAREVYQQHLNQVSNIIRLTAVRFFLTQGLLEKNIESIQTKLIHIREAEGMDLLTLTDKKGTVLFRSNNPQLYGDNISQNPIIQQTLTSNELTSSTLILPRKELMKEGADLAEQAYIRFISTPKARPRDEDVETSGMVILSAAPIYDHDGILIGVLYGGNLTNRDYAIVDQVKDIVYKGQSYHGTDIGTVTIFQGDLRISTNVKQNNGSRAIGTRVSRDVYEQVLIQGLPWIERAFVVNDWYITAYEPIYDFQKNIIGMLYVGILERPFVDLRKRTIWIFIGITLVSLVTAMIISYILAQRLTRPIKALVTASQAMADGNLEQRVNIFSHDEIGELGETFNYMAHAIKDRDEKLKRNAQQKIMESERLATIGQLAAGVAHELNNPLGGILVFSHLLQEKMDPSNPQRKHVEKVIQQTTRCKKIVHGLLDFSRQTKPKKVPVQVHTILEAALSLLKNQKIFQNIKIIKKLKSDLPHILADKGQIQQVFINILMNAAQSMTDEGELTIKIDNIDDSDIEIVFIDNGCGIPEKDIVHIFEPFFTTKEVGSGTGLGLSISYGIIQNHQGIIEVKSELGKGSVFTVKLPVVKEK